MTTTTNAPLASFADLLAAYRRESAGTPDALTVAQNIVERLDAECVFQRLAELRDDIAARLDDEHRDRQLIAEDALDDLTDLLGKD